MAERLVVVGGGPAGLSSVTSHREGGGGGDVVLISADDTPPSDRPSLSKDYLRSSMDEGPLDLEEKAFYRDNGVTVRLSTQVTGLHPEEHRLVVAGSESVAFTSCVLATGSASTPRGRPRGPLRSRPRRQGAARRRLRVEHWGEALEMGEVAGATIPGEPAEWAQAPGFWSTIGDRTLKYVAWGDGFADTILHTYAGGAFTVWYLNDDGIVVGALTHGADDDYDLAKGLIERGAPSTQLRAAAP